MKKVIITLILLMPLFLMAQTSPPIFQGSKYYEFRNAIRPDSAIFLPRKDTFIYDATLKAEGMITFRPQDKKLYLFDGHNWTNIFSGIPSVPNLQSVTDTGNTTNNSIAITGFGKLQDTTGLHVGNGFIYSGNPIAGRFSPLTMQSFGLGILTHGAAYTLSAGSIDMISDNVAQIGGNKVSFNSVLPAEFNSRVSGVAATTDLNFVVKRQLDSLNDALYDSIQANAVTASNGLTKVARDIQLGGTFTTDRIVQANNGSNMYIRGTYGTDFTSDQNTAEIRVRATGIRSRVIDNNDGLLSSINQTASGVDIQGTAPWNFFLNNGNEIRVDITPDSFRVVHDKIRLQGSVQADRIGIGKVPGRLFEAVKGTGLFAWDGKGLQLADDSTTNLNTWIGYKSGLAASGGQNTAYGYAAGEFLGGNWNTVAGYGSAVATAGNGNTLSGYRSAYNVNNNYSSGVGYQSFYDMYGDNNSQLGANILINSNSYLHADTIHTSDINNTILSGVTIRNLIDGLGLHTGDVYVGKMRWLNTPPVLGSPSYYKFRIDSTAGTLTSQTFSHNVDTGFGLIVLNIVPHITSTTVLGANATADSSRQVVLGDTTAAQMKTGRWKWDIAQMPTDGQVWSYNATRKRWAPGNASGTTSTNTYGQFKMNYVGAYPVTNPVIAVNPAGWDQAFDELGNIIKVGSSYIMVYSGYQTPYVQDQVYIGLATSTDGVSWTKGGPSADGKIITTGSEDPYLVYNSGTYYLYVEKKVSTGSFHAGVQLFTSTDLLTWSDQGVVVPAGGVGSWEEQDASSPTVFIENGTWNMFYEGRSPTQSGAVGLATSTDGITWTKYGGNPIVGGTGTTSTIGWALNVVPDDVFKVGEFYYLSFHGSHPSVYSGGMAVSNNLTTWKDNFGSWLLTDQNNESTGDGLMYHFDGSEYIVHYISGSGTGISLGRSSIKNDYALGSKAISTSGTLAAGATTITGTLGVSGTFTGAAISGTTGTFSGLVAMASGYTTNNNALNWFIPSAQGGGASTNAKFLFGSGSNTAFRRATGGTTTVAVAANAGYAGTVYGGENVSLAATGTHTPFASLVVKPYRVIGTGAPVSIGAIIWADSNAVGGIRNYSVYLNTGDLKLSSGKVFLGRTQTGLTTDSILVKSATDSSIRAVAASAFGFGTGTVTSVGLSLPAIFSVSGSPVTTSGTLTGTLATQSANTIFAGPTSGGAATPAFRALVAADLPAIPATNNGFATTSDADYTVQATDKFILLIHTTALRTLTLPNPASSVRELWIRCAANGSGEWQTGTTGFVGCGQIGTPPFTPSSNVAFTSNTTIHLVSNGTSWHCFQ